MTVEPETFILLAEYCAAQKRHSGDTLLSHLRGTFELLDAWGNSRDACHAGLFHGAYGTETYVPQTIPLSERARVRQAIGERAETLVYLFCVSHRPFFMTLTAEQPIVHDRLLDRQLAVTGEQLHDLVEIEAANWVEQMPRYSMHVDELDRFAVGVDASKNLMSSKAYRAMLRALLDKYRDPPTLQRRASHALVHCVPMLRSTIGAARRWRDMM